MPDPKKFDNKDDFMKACIPIVLREGTAEDGSQAAAICHSMWKNRNKKSDNTDIEIKHFGGQVNEVKVATRNGVKVGTVGGHLAAWAPDLGGIYGMPDRFHRGAFLESIAEHKSRGNRPIRLRDMHGRTIGGFPIDEVWEDDIGLRVKGEINLEVQQGMEAFSLARQGVLTDFSIGFVAIQDDISGGYRDIFKADVREGSIVDEPLNRLAQITEVKSARFYDLPLADRFHSWDKSAAADRAKLFASEDCKKAFVWSDGAEYKLLITDLVDGELKVVPQAVFDAAMAVRRGDVDIPESDLPGVIHHIERYFAKMGLVSPFIAEENHFFGTDEVKRFDRRDLERTLIGTGLFSQKAAKIIAARYSEPADPKLLDAIRTIKLSL